MKTIFELLKPCEKDLQTAYKCGARIPPELLRDIKIFEEFINTEKQEPSKMQRYANLSEKYGICERNTKSGKKYAGSGVIFFKKSCLKTFLLR